VSPRPAGRDLQDAEVAAQFVATRGRPALAQGRAHVQAQDLEKGGEEVRKDGIVYRSMGT
jgi:hypothetical protein